MGGAGPDRLHAAAAVGVEAAAHDAELGLVGVAGDEAGVALGDEGGGPLALVGVVALDVALAAGGGRHDGVVHPQHGDDHDHGDEQADADGGGADADEPALGVEAEQAAHAGEPRGEPQHQGGEERDEQVPAAPEHLPVEQAGGEHLADAAGVVEPAQAFEQAAGGVGLLHLREDLAHDVVAERRVDRRAGVDEAVEGVVLVAVDDVDLLRAAVGGDHEVEGDGDLGGAGAVDDGLDHGAVPGDAAVVVAGEHHEVAAVVAVDPLLQRGAEARRGCRGWARCGGSAPASISKPSPAMTTAPPPVQRADPVDQGLGAGRGGVGHGGARGAGRRRRRPCRPGRSRSRRGRARGGGWRWCSARGRRPRPRAWPGWSAAAPARGAGSGRG